MNIESVQSEQFPAQSAASIVLLQLGFSLMNTFLMRVVWVSVGTDVTFHLRRLQINNTKVEM